MNLTKAQNPFGVQAGQKWKPKDKRREETFIIGKIDKWWTLYGRDGNYALAEYRRHGDKDKPIEKSSWINILRFDRYVRVK